LPWANQRRDFRVKTTMSQREDILRALEYGKDEYYKAIQQIPAYRREANKIYTDHESGLWIALEKFLPKFSTEEFKKMRKEFQAKYGTKINIPGFEDIIHIGTLAKISDQEMAAHRTAQKLKVPSPLSPEQLRTLAVKKARYIRALSSPTPSWANNITSVAMALDNVEDGLVTLSVLGRLGSYATTKLWQREIPGVGWVMLGADILNFFNIISWVTFAASGAKRKLERLAERNPFHRKMKAKRAMKLKRTWPTFGEALEIAQTCDQLFGYGLCLGGIVGMASDILTRAEEYVTYRFKPEVFNFNILEGDTPKNREAMNKIADELFSKLATDFNTLKNYMKDVAYGLKTQDDYLRKLLEIESTKATSWIKNSAEFAWNKFIQYPASSYNMYSSALMGGMIASTGTENLSRDDQIKVYIGASAAMTPLQQLWKEADPLSAFKNLRQYKFTPPRPTDAGTIATLEELTENWLEKLRWPFLDTREATAEELYFNYAHRIKDQFQTFCLIHKNEYAAAIGAGEVTDFVEKILRTFSDDGTVESGRSEYVNAAINMARDHLLIPPDTSQDKINSFNSWVGSYANTFGNAPSSGEIKRIGETIGIKFMENFPRRTFTEAYKLFPQWQALQDQLEDLYVPD
jgi:hypothetical protein